jgi:protein-S-isoprenylcysteine O-methyltransferase Ste14
MSTEIHTFKKPRQLVTHGLFRHSRNPIYVGFVCILWGLSMLLGSLSTFIVVLAFVIITDRWYIPFEEKNMEEVFDKAYKQYKKEVRRWL